MKNTMKILSIALVGVSLQAQTSNVPKGNLLSVGFHAGGAFGSSTVTYREELKGSKLLFIDKGLKGVLAGLTLTYENIKDKRMLGLQYMFNGGAVSGVYNQAAPQQDVHRFNTRLNYENFLFGRLGFCVSCCTIMYMKLGAGMGSFKLTSRSDLDNAPTKAVSYKQRFGFSGGLGLETYYDKNKAFTLDVRATKYKKSDHLHTDGKLKEMHSSKPTVMSATVGLKYTF